MMLPSQQLAALKEVMAAEFTTHELQLFLDTHPDDMQAMMAHHDACMRTMELQTAYSQQYGCHALMPCCEMGQMDPMGQMGPTERFSWVDSPWPWEIQY